MSIRNEALKWYKLKYKKLDLPIYTSKWFRPEESWPKKSVWWPQIPIKALEGNSDINVLCQVAPNKNDFHHLRIPTKFFKQHLESFHLLKGIISLYLLTDPKKFLVEVRGKDNINFISFLINPSTINS